MIQNLRGNMSKRILVAVIVCYIFSFRLWAFPVYDVGSGFFGFTRTNHEIKSSFQYAEAETSDGNMIRQKNIEAKKNKEYKVLWQNSDPYYLKYTNSDGSAVYWKTTKLHTSKSGDNWQDAMGSQGINMEYQVMPIDVTDEGVLLFDPDNSQYVYKLDDGNSFSISKDISEYRIMNNIHYELGAKPKQWVFVKHNSGLDFSMAIVNHDGSVSMKLACNQPVSRISRIYCNLPAERYLVDYSDKQGKRGLLILSHSGVVIRNYSNYNPGNVIAFYENAAQYVTTRNEFSSRHVIDLTDGEIKVELKIEHLDLAFSNGSLRAIVCSGRHLGIIDALKGVLIQDLSDFNRDYRIEWVRFQNMGKDVFIAERSPGKSSSTIKHFQQAM